MFYIEIFVIRTVYLVNDFWLFATVVSYCGLPTIANSVIAGTSTTSVSCHTTQSLILISTDLFAMLFEYAYINAEVCDDNVACGNNGKRVIDQIDQSNQLL